MQHRAYSGCFAQTAALQHRCCCSADAVSRWWVSARLWKKHLWGSFAAFYNDVKAFCCVVQRCGVVLGRSATMWCRFAPSCNDVVLILQRRSSFSRVGPHSLENERAALIWCRFAAFCNDVVSFCGVLQRCGILLRRSALIWGHL